MNTQLIINILITILSVFAVIITLASFLYSLNIKEKTKNLQLKRTNQELQKLEPKDTSKESDLAAYKINTDTWKSLEDIIGGLRKLSLVRHDADKAFLSIVQILLTSFLQSLEVNKESKSSPDYQNISFLIMINDTDESIHYSKGWKHELVSEDDFYQSDVTVARNENASFEYRFIGTGINCFAGILPSRSTNPY